MIVFVVAVVIGLVNGLLVAVFDLNPLIVTLSTGLILLGITAEYRLGTANESTGPRRAVRLRVRQGVRHQQDVLVRRRARRLLVALILRSTTVGRRFQAVGANRRAAWMAGIRVRLYVIGAYVFAALAAGLAAHLRRRHRRSAPGSIPGVAYLLGPVAAVVLGGAALSGGLASATSTWVAAFFVTLLNQMLKVLGLANASQYVVFGLAIIVGMVISGDRIADIIGRLLLRPGIRNMMGDDGEPPLPATASEPNPPPTGSRSAPRSRPSPADHDPRPGPGRANRHPAHDEAVRTHHERLPRGEHT